MISIKSDQYQSCQFGPLGRFFPKNVLKKYGPNHAHLVDHITVRVARVFTSSVFFALHHSWAHTCSFGDMYPYMMAGIVFGTLQELSGHPIYNLISHVAINSIISGII